MTELIVEILQICERKAKSGELFEVHKFRYRDDLKRKAVKGLCRDGKLILANNTNPYMSFYRPEDAATIEKAWAKQEAKMKTLHAKNVQWHLDQATKNQDKNNGLYEYHLKEAEKERALSV